MQNSYKKTNRLINSLSPYLIQHAHNPVDWYEFSGSEALYETIYSPPETQVMRRAKAAGCRVTNGLGMLQAQAEAQFSLFSGMDYPHH